MPSPSPQKTEPSMANARKPPERVRDFNSLAEYHSSTARDGDIDAPLFEGRPIRRIVHAGAPWFSVVDVIAALTDSDNPNSYWGKLKERVVAEAGQEWEPLTKCQRLKLPATDGKMRETDCADIETLNRIVQSIPSPKVEPWKQWLARIGYERIQETAEPSLAIERAIGTYRKMGRDEAWIEDRIGTIAANNEKTDQWKERGVAGNQYSKLNAEMSKEAFGVTPQQHCDMKGLPSSAKRQDHMTRLELQIQRLADTAATEIMVARDTKAFPETRKASLDGAGWRGSAGA
jgi:DNA-damage-inducible protein D